MKTNRVLELIYLNKISDNFFNKIPDSVIKTIPPTIPFMERNKSTAEKA